MAPNPLSGFFKRRGLVREIRAKEKYFSRPDELEEPTRLIFRTKSYLEVRRESIAQIGEHAEKSIAALQKINAHLGKHGIPNFNFLNTDLIGEVGFHGIIAHVLGKSAEKFDSLQRGHRFFDGAVMAKGHNINVEILKGKKDIIIVTHKAGPGIAEKPQVFEAPVTEEFLQNCKSYAWEIENGFRKLILHKQQHWQKRRNRHK